MSTVTFLVHPERPDALALANDTAEWLTSRGDAARILQFSALDQVTESGTARHVDAVDLEGTTVAVSMGGDGTFLRVVRMARNADVPVLGVNFGQLGYLPDLLPDQLRDALTRVFDGKAVIEDRCALEVTLSDRSPDDASPLLALNEVLLEKISPGHTVRLTTTIDGEEALTYSADGLIIATPTGSTAYNLSAGGPILSPALRAMVVTAVAPHLSLDRSLVLTDEQPICVEIAADRAAVLVIDGQEVGHRAPGTTITCRVAPRSVRVVRNDPQKFGGMLRVRLLADRGW
jgi:NAD+ kinase